MAMLDIVGQNLTGYTAYNEYITDVVIAVLVYLSAFSLVIRLWLTSRKKKPAQPIADAPPAAEADAPPAAENEEEGGQA